MLVLDGNRLTLRDVVRVARDRAPVSASVESLAAVEAARTFLEREVASGRVIYGVNTGLGHMAGVAVESGSLEGLQRNMVRSHAAGFGPPLADDEVRAILLLKYNLFLKGHSGVRPVLVRQLEAMLREDVLPVVPAKGSLGASGDLAPLAHVALAILGEGQARLGGEAMPAADALRRAGLEPLELSYREGLGLMNGCQVMAARGALLLHDAWNLWGVAQAFGAAVLDVFGAADAPFHPSVHRIRPYPGQAAVAANICRLLAGKRHLGDRVQDAYSLRCIPQILGGVADTFHDLERRLEIEINAASDNPLVFPAEGRIIAAGNFHGQSLSLGLDAFKAAASVIAGLAERQINRLLNPALSGLPAFLAAETGEHSGMMILQYSAASLVSENKVLSHPSSVDSIPVSGDQEDYVPMGAASAHQAAEILRNVTDVLAVGILCVTQAMDLRTPGGFAKASGALRDHVRELVPFWSEDRYAAADANVLADDIRSGRLLGAVEAVAGPLGRWGEDA